jgi:hypothetical protein
MTIKPIEVPILYLRRGHPGVPAELVIGYDGDPSMVYVLRPGQLANLAIDATRFALAGKKE